MNRRTCPHCKGRSYSSYSGPNWDCPYCGKNLGDVPDQLSEIAGDSLNKEIDGIEIYGVTGADLERNKVD